MDSDRLTPDEVAKVASLARLKLSETEGETFAGQLAQVLGYVRILDGVETESVEPMAHAVEVTDVFREDAVGASLSREEALANAPKSNGRFFVVPQILEG